MKALIVAGGRPPKAALLHRRADEADLLIAADRGAEAFAAAGLLPGLLVGDFDSAAPETVQDAVRAGALCVQVPREKNETDLELAVRLAVDRGAGDICILGATGGRVDHLLGNLAVLLWLQGKGVAAVLEDDRQIITCAAGDFSVTGTPGETVSILPARSQATVSASGLLYPLEHLTLSADQARGVSNVLTAPEASVTADAPVYIIRIRPGSET